MVDIPDELLTRIDSGFHDIHKLKKYLVAEIPRMAGNPNLNHTHYHTLMFLAGHGPDCMKGICRHLGIEAGSFTPVADRIINEGLAFRRTDSEDRRRTLLQLTDRGERTVGELRTIIRDQMKHRLGRLDGEQLRTLAESMDNIGRITRVLQENMHEQQHSE